MVASAQGRLAGATFRASSSVSSRRVGHRRHMQRYVSCTAGDNKSLLVVGPGVLGSCLGYHWKLAYPEATVVGQTNTSSNHDRLQRLGFTVRLKEAADATTFSHVVFCAPPSGSADYPGEVKAACDFWDGTGALVFTSSAGVYTAKSGECDEDCEVSEKGCSERTDRLLLAEEATLAAGGNVVRLVGLYHGQRGAHTFFLRKGKIERNGQSVVNLIHYEDAASLVMAVLQGQGSDGGYRGQVFVGSDDTPLTFEEMMEACYASGAFEGSVAFTGQEPPSGKRMLSRRSKERLHWQPKYASFVDFMQTQKGLDWYSNSSAS